MPPSKNAADQQRTTLDADALRAMLRSEKNKDPGDCFDDPKVRERIAEIIARAALKSKKPRKPR